MFVGGISPPNQTPIPQTPIQKPLRTFSLHHACRWYGRPCHPNATAFVQPKDTVWDQIFDNGDVKPTTGRPNHFRCPENLHAFLREEATRKRKDLWVLAQMIDTRALMAQAIGKNTITEDYQVFENAHVDEVMLRGDRTGTGGHTPGTIMWRELNQAPAFWKRV